MELAPTEPELLTGPKLRKCTFNKKFEGAQVLFVNYQYEQNYHHILTKLVSLISILPPALVLLVVTLPPNATYVDTTLAEHLQRMMPAKHGDGANTLVLFIKHSDKNHLVENIFAGKGADYKELPGLRVRSLELAEDALVYAWGNAANGKLGVADNYYAEFEADQLNSFYSDDQFDNTKDLGEVLGEEALR